MPSFSATSPQNRNHKEHHHAEKNVGKKRLEVSAIGFGCMGLNFGYGTALEQG